MKNTFGENIIPDNEAERLNVLKQYDLKDPHVKNGLDKIAKLAARIFNVPIALATIVDKEEVRFIGNVGMENTSKVSRGISLCSLAILDDSLTIFENPVQEPCLLANPLVHGEFGLKFYAAWPIMTEDEFKIGSVCIVDKQQRFFSQSQIAVLEDLAALAMDYINTAKIHH
jgi:GAF domain-containing protein